MSKLKNSVQVKKVCICEVKRNAIVTPVDPSQLGENTIYWLLRRNTSPSKKKKKKYISRKNKYPNKIHCPCWQIVTHSQLITNILR